jgi:hypothetical protein
MEVFVKSDRYKSKVRLMAVEEEGRASLIPG